MPLSCRKPLIIGCLVWLLMALAGCSAVRLTYGNGAQLAWWWLDGYMDFSSEQTPRVREALERWFAWHRQTQLPDYAATLAAAQAQVLEPTTPAAVCRWQQALLDRLDPALQRAAEDGADLVPWLGEAQLRHLEAQFAKKNAEFRRDFLQPNPADRHDAAVDRVVERFEQIYGRASAAQRQLIDAGVSASPFDPQAWLAERQRRQKDLVATLRRLLADKAPRDEVLAALRVQLERVERSPDPGYRAYHDRLTDYNCAFGAQIHNATTATQRQEAKDRFKGWEDDLRALAATRP